MNLSAMLLNWGFTQLTLFNSPIKTSIIFKTPIPLLARELDATRLAPVIPIKIYKRSPTIIAHEALTRQTSIDPVQAIISEGKPMKSQKLGQYSLNRKMNILTYIMNLHGISDQLYPARNVFSNKDLWKKKINFFIEKRKRINDFKGKLFRQEKIRSFTKSVSDISQAIEFTKKVLRKSGSSTEVDHIISKLEEVEKTIQLLFKKKLNVELFSRERAYFIIESLDHNVSEIIVNFLRERVLNEIEGLLKLKKLRNADDLKVLQATTFLILNNVRKHHLAHEGSLKTILINRNTISSLAKLSLKSDLTFGFRSYSSKFKSMEVIWRDSLNELIQEIPKEEYQVHYCAEKSRISRILLQEQQILEKENELTEYYHSKNDFSAIGSTILG